MELPKVYFGVTRTEFVVRSASKDSEPEAGFCGFFPMKFFLPVSFLQAQPFAKHFFLKILFDCPASFSAPQAAYGVPPFSLKHVSSLNSSTVENLVVSPQFHKWIQGRGPR